MGNEQIERWYSMKEISKYLGITRDTALSWIEKRGMPGVKVGRTWKFKISEVDIWTIMAYGKSLHMSVLRSKDSRTLSVLPIYR